MLFTYQTPTYLPRIRILRSTESKRNKRKSTWSCSRLRAVRYLSKSIYPRCNKLKGSDGRCRRNSLYIKTTLYSFCMYKLEAIMPISAFCSTACTQDHAPATSACTSCICLGTCMGKHTTFHLINKKRPRSIAARSFDFSLLYKGLRPCFSRGNSTQ